MQVAIRLLLVLAGGVAIAAPVDTTGNPLDPIAILKHAASWLPAAFSLGMAICTALGIVMIASSLWMLYLLTDPDGNSRLSTTQASHQGAWGQMFFGTLLGGIGIFNRTIANSIFNGDDISSLKNIAYQTAGFSDEFLVAYVAIMNLVALAGLYACARGILAWNAFNRGIQGYNSPWTGFWFFVGGIGMLYMPETLSVFEALWGFNPVKMFVA